MRLHRIVGLLLVVAPLSVGALDAYWGARNWSNMGPLPPGDASPAFAVAMLDGDVITPRSLLGKVTVMTFWATWCGVCRTELADLDELDDRYRDNADVQFLAINREGTGLREARARVEAYRSQHGLALPVALDDGSMARTFRVGPIPHTVVVDQGGVLRHIHQGRVSASTIQEEVDGLLAE